MKIDLDTIFYLIITIVILALTGLSRRKKKRPVPGHELQGADEQESESTRNDRFPGTEDVISDPFERLENLFKQPEPVDTPKVVSLEEIVDEETEYLEEKEAASKGKPPGEEILKEDLTKQSLQMEEEIRIRRMGKLKLFENVCELRKAVIYAEILNRKEY
jgi:hypothetical protein